MVSVNAAIVGHAHEEVKAALHAQVEKGTSFGAPCAMEVGFLSLLQLLSDVEPKSCCIN